MPENIVELETEHDLSPATKFDVDQMITERLLQFHQAVIDRGQIKPITSGLAELANPTKAVEEVST